MDDLKIKALEQLLQSSDKEDELAELLASKLGPIAESEEPVTEEEMEDIRSQLESIEDTGRDPAGYNIPRSVKKRVRKLQRKTSPMELKKYLTPKHLSEDRYEELKEMIADKESGGDYNIGNRRTKEKGKTKIRLSKVKDLTGKTIKQIMEEQNKGNLFAAGKYQMINPTIRQLVNWGVVNPNDKFDEETQEKMANALLDIKRKETGAYLSGSGDNNLDKAALGGAKEWASLPVTKDTTRRGKPVKRGQSYYQSNKFDKAYHTPEEYEKMLRETRDKNITDQLMNELEYGVEEGEDGKVRGSSFKRKWNSLKD